MKILSDKKKKSLAGGSFYTIALGIGTLLSSITSVAGTIIEIAKAANPNQSSYQKSGYATKRSKTYMRLSPIPSRSAVSIWM